MLKSFVGTIKVTYGDVEFGIDTDPEKGAADSGDLQGDLPNLFAAVAEAAEERKAAVAILIDEVQYFTLSELSALIMAMHRMQQGQYPWTIVLGYRFFPAWPASPNRMPSDCSAFPTWDRCPRSRMRLRHCRIPCGWREWTSRLPLWMRLTRLTEGYPYFIQEWGYRAWNQWHGFADHPGSCAGGNADGDRTAGQELLPRAF